MENKIDQILAGKKNPGLIRVGREMIKDFVAMAVIFQEFEPWEFKLEIISNTYFMLVMSEHFDSLEPGEEIPFYEFVISYRNSDFYISEVRRLK